MKGRWVKGQSGNPRGIPKKIADWVDKEALPAFERIKERSLDSSVPDNVKQDGDKFIINTSLGNSGEDNGTPREVKIIVEIEGSSGLTEGNKDSER